MLLLLQITPPQHTHRERTRSDRVVRVLAVLSACLPFGAFLEACSSPLLPFFNNRPGFEAQDPPFPPLLTTAQHTCCAAAGGGAAGAPRLITALHVASYHNQQDMVQLLLDKGIQVCVCVWVGGGRRGVGAQRFWGGKGAGAEVRKYVCPCPGVLANMRSEHVSKHPASSVCVLGGG